MVLIISRARACFLDNGESVYTRFIVRRTFVDSLLSRFIIVYARRLHGKYILATGVHRSARLRRTPQISPATSRCRPRYSQHPAASSASKPLLILLLLLITYTFSDKRASNKIPDIFIAAARTISN
ncbi:hypothetical protein PUN28_009584 [Cardiocondyla obscurior]|uniref:Uncharacterized protein n=1 Tax=Cardiocondyla obscurior TaxID=286306 RepID=A0AAW2FUC0_9HYME